MYASTKFGHASIRKKAKIVVKTYDIIFKKSVIILHILKFVRSSVSMDILESIEVIELYNRDIKRSQSF